MDDSADDAPGVPEWVVTYGDMMSLLLTFFIMLVSMSEMKSDEGKTRAMLDGIRQAFGPTKSTFGAPGNSLQSTSILDKMASRSARSEGGTERTGSKSEGPAGPHQASSRLSEGTLITLGGPAQFPRFEANMNENLKRNLDIIARVVGPKTNRIMVRGHASPEPLPTDGDFAGTVVGCAVLWPKRQQRGFLQVQGLDIRSQFDLSFARAKAAAEYLISKNIDPRRLIITAAGDTEPRVLTRNRDKQQQNRRVDVFLVDSYITHPQPAP